MFSAKKRQYAPNEDELNTAISSVLQENELASVDDIHTIITRHHRNWKLPERRVAKFVKRQQQNVMPWEQTDDEMSRSSTGSGIKRAVSSAVKGTGRGIKKVLLFGRSEKKEADGGASVQTGSTTPPTEIRTSSRKASSFPMTPLTVGDPKKLQLFTPTGASSPRELFKVTGLADDDDLSNVYADDNDGKREGTWCEPCEGCAIL